MRIRFLGVGILVAVSAFSTNLSFASSGEVHEFKMANGMKVLVKEDHRAPVVVSQVWYKVGGSYEYSGITDARSSSRMFNCSDVVIAVAVMK